MSTNPISMGSPFFNRRTDTISGSEKPTEEKNHDQNIDDLLAVDFTGIQKALARRIEDAQANPETTPAVHTIGHKLLTYNEFLEKQKQGSPEKIEAIARELKKRESIKSQLELFFMKDENGKLFTNGITLRIKLKALIRPPIRAMQDMAKIPAIAKTLGKEIYPGIADYLNHNSEEDILNAVVDTITIDELSKEASK